MFAPVFDPFPGFSFWKGPRGQGELEIPAHICSELSMIARTQVFFERDGVFSGIILTVFWVCGLLPFNPFPRGDCDHKIMRPVSAAFSRG